MEEFDPVIYAEKLLKKHEIINLTSLENSLKQVKIQVEAEQQTAIFEIEKAQNELKLKGGLEMFSTLVDRKNKAQKGLDMTGKYVTQLNQVYTETNRLIEEKDNHRKNAILMYGLVNELLHLNK